MADTRTEHGIKASPTTTLGAHIPTEGWQQTLTVVAFWALACAALLNFNHIANLAVGFGWPVSIAIATCCAFLLLVTRVPLRDSLGVPGYLVVGALSSYLVIGTAVALLVGISDLVFDVSLPTRIILGVLVLLASAAGATAMLKHVGIDSLLSGVALILAAVSFLILATPLLEEHLYIPRLEHLTSARTSRSSGPFADANLAGLAACNAAVAGLTLFHSRSNRLIGALALILGSAAVVLSYSRTALIALALVGAYFMLAAAPRHIKGSRSFRLRPAIALVAIGIIVFFITIEHLPFGIPWQRVTSLFSIEKLVANERMLIFALGLSQITDSWLVGNGLFSFRQIEGAPRCRGEIVCSVHNSYLQFWGESGLFPLTLLVGGIFLLLWAGTRLRQHPVMNAVVGWTLVFATACAAFDDVPISIWHSFLVGLSCAFVCHSIRQQRIVDQQLR